MFLALSKNKPIGIVIHTSLKRLVLQERFSLNFGLENGTDHVTVNLLLRIVAADVAKQQARNSALFSH